MKTQITLLLYIFIINTFTAISLEAQPSSPLLEKFYSERIIITNRNFTSYHYEENKENKLIAHKDFRQYENLRIQAAGFWDIHKIDSAVGPGYYVALDPYSSRLFGAENWILHIAIIKKGTRLLDIRDSNWLPENIKAELSEIGCEDNFSTFLSLRVHKKLECREMLLNILRKLKVDGVYYQYAGYELPRCSFTPEAAINISNPDVVDRYYFTSFALNQKKHLQVEYLRQYTNQFFRELAADKEDYEPLWSDTKFAKESLYTNYLKNQIVGCSLNDQDLSLYALLANYNRILDGSNFDPSILNHETLLKIRFIGSSYERYQKFKNLSFETIKQTQEYQQWLQLLEITHLSDLNSAERFSEKLQAQLKLLNAEKELSQTEAQLLYWTLKPILSSNTYVRADLLSRNRSQFIKIFKDFDVPSLVAQVYFEKSFIDMSYPPPVILFDEHQNSEPLNSRLAIMRGMRLYTEILKQLATSP